MWHLKHLKMVFGDRVILQSISATLKRGEIIALQGDNGSGKSTLLNMLSGSLIPSSGSIEYQGNDITHQTELERASLLGRLMQDPAAARALDMSVAQNLTLASLKGQPARLKKVHLRLTEEVLQMAEELGLPLEKLYLLPTSHLSGGQRQSLALIMALLNKPKLLLLDEPTAALDSRSSTRLLTFVQKWTNTHQAATVMITHEVKEADLIATGRWTIEEGKLVITT